MSTAALLDQLDHATDTDREAIYAASTATLALADMQAALAARRPSATWVIKRYFAGPPGEPLPEADAALRRVLTGEGGTTDAYTVLYAGLTLPSGPGLVGVIQNGAAGAIQERVTHFSASLAAMAAVACLIGGDTERAWAWFDLDLALKGMPTFEILRSLTALRGRASLADELWLRRAAWGHWPGHAPRAVPELPLPEVAADGLDRSKLLAAIKELGNEELVEWVQTGLQAWDARVADHLETNDVIRAIRAAVLHGAAQPPEVRPPEGLLEWIRTAHERGQHAAARLGALLLLRTGDAEPDLWMYVAFDLRAADLPSLMEHVSEDLRPYFKEGAAVLSEAPPHLREPLAQVVFLLHPKMMDAAQVLREEIAVLRALSSPDRPWLEATLTWLETLRAHSVMEASPALRAAIRLVLDRVGPLAHATLDTLLGAIEQAPQLDGARDVFGLDALPAAEQLVGAMMLRRGAGDRIRAGLAHVAAQAIWEVLLRQFFPLRIELLQEVIRETISPVTLAWALKALANTRNALADGDLDVLRQNVGLFEQAARIAQEAGETTIFVDAIVNGARTLTFGLLNEPGSEGLRNEALQRLNLALTYPVEAGLRASVLWVKASLLLNPGPNGCDADVQAAIPLLREACAIAPEDHWKLDIERELSFALRSAGLFKDAVQIARSALDRATPDLMPTDRGILHGHLADQLAAAGETTDAERHFREALRLLGDDHDGGLMYIRYADLLLRRGDAREARDLLGRLLGRGGKLIRVDQIGANRLLAAAHAQLGDLREAEAATRVALVAAAGSTFEPVVLAEAAEHRGDHAQLFDLTRRYLDGEWPRSPSSDDHFEGVLANSVDQLEEPLRRHGLGWARASGRSLLEARLLGAVGDVPGALGVVDGVIREGGPDERLAARLLKIATLPEGEVGARRLEIDAIEAEVGDPLDLPGTSLCDLAAACGLATAGEPGWSNRALWYAQHAFAAGQGQGWRTHAARTWVRLVRDRLVLEGVASTVGVCSSVRAALPAVAALHLGERRGALELVAWLLLAGPLTHPERIAAASAVIERLGDDDAVRGLRARAVSITDVRDQANTSVAPLPETFNATTPFNDRPPEWFVDVIVRGKHRSPPVALLGDGMALVTAVRTRPDRADVMLALWLEAAVARGTDLLATAAELCRVCVDVGDQGAGTWPELRSAVARLPVAAEPFIRSLRHSLRFAARAEDRTGDTERSLAAAPIDEEDHHARFKRAVASMHAAQRAADQVESRTYKTAAIRELDVLQLRWRGTENELDALVSLGNAHRLEPEANIVFAVELYRRADELPGANDDQKGKLHKVWSDALRDLGGDANIRLAWEHIQRALRHRRDGYVRSEALFSASHLASMHPDFPPDQRTMTSARLLAEAVQVDAVVSEQLLPRLLADLAKWKVFGLREPERLAILDSLRAAYPTWGAAIERARGGAAEGPFGIPLPGMAERERLVRLFKDPDFKVLIEVELALLPPDTKNTNVDHIAERMPLRRPLPAPGNREKRRAEAREKHSTPGLKGILNGLTQRAAKRLRGYAGRTVGRFVVLVELLRRGEGSLPSVRRAGLDARKALDGAKVSTEFQIHALRAMAEAWSPADTVSDPVTDFDLAADLARQAINLEAGDACASRDTLSTLGRALRYQRGGRVAENVREARRLFARCVELDRAAQNGEALALDLVRLSDVETFLAEGDEVARLRRSEALEREARSVAVSEPMKSLAAGNLAWTLTLLGGRLPPAEARAALTEALTLYQQARGAKTGRRDNRSLDNNEAVCRTHLAELDGRSDEAVDAARERMHRLRGVGSTLEYAEAQHNLAEGLYRRGSEKDVAQAIDLYRDALRFRTIEGDVRKHWQTALGLGRSLLSLVDAEDEPEVGWFDESEAALRSAIAAARVLGPGRELAWAAMELCRLSQFGADSRAVDTRANDAWTALREATPYLLLHPESRLEEAMLAENVAYVIANDAAQEGVLAPLPGGAALGRRASERVVRWLLRAEAPFQRVLEALFRFPGSLAGTDRLAWQEAVAARRSGEVVARLRDIHQTHPDWLRNDPSLAETERWLKAAPGSMAIAVRPGKGGAMVTLIDGDTRNTAVLLLFGPVPPLSEEQVSKVLRDENRRADLLEKLVDWAQKVVLARIRQFIGQVPKRILWLPHGILRLVPPSRLFPGTAVSVSSSLALRGPVASRSRSEGSVVVVADPGVGPGHLGTEAIKGAERLVATLGGGRLILAVGARSGSDVSSIAVSGGPTTAQVLREFDHAGFAVVIAHGHTEGVDEAWIELLAPDGSPDRLDIAALLRDPGAIAGLSVVLLSCETGRADAAADRPGGVAGALLLAGAKEVVAPLWPISLLSALAIGDALCEARAQGRGLAEALAIAAQRTGSGGPSLGRVTPERRAAAAWDPAAFFIWVG